MLSICIPIYNYDISVLVNQLHQQAIVCSIPFEIILMDDASANEYRVINSLVNLPFVRYIQLDQNIGRSKIRNVLAEEAKYPFLIFMDCDSGVSSSLYIANYIPWLRPGIVCYGGRIYESLKPHDSTFLRWKYGVERESIPASQRKINPNYGFCTTNFLIDKLIFKDVNFNENLKGYGHEDTLFGLELLGKGIEVEHIDNPLIHLGLEDAEIFLEKTENGVLNLSRVEQLLQEKYPFLVNHSRLMKTKNLLEKMHMSRFFAGIYRIFRSTLKRNLLSARPSLFCFDLYRLGCLVDIKTQDLVHTQIP